ncbi:MAG: OmpA family protein [Deltaproteobacteria bacterium]|nr:OmpA family protein [Deltaproteobacteria bacterium]
MARQSVILGFVAVGSFATSAVAAAPTTCDKVAKGIEKTVRFVNDKFLAKLKLTGSTSLGPATLRAESRPPTIKATASASGNKINVTLEFTKGTADVTASATGLSARAHLEYPASVPKKETFWFLCPNLDCDKLFGAKVDGRPILQYIKDRLNRFVSTLPTKIEDKKSGFSLTLRWPELKTLSYNERTNIISVETTKWGLTAVAYTVRVKGAGKAVDDLWNKVKENFDTDLSRVNLKLDANWGPIRLEIPCALKEDKPVKPDDDGGKEDPPVKCGSSMPGFIEFDFDKDNVDERKNRGELPAFERMVKSLEPGNSVQVIAHTDCVGNFIYNVDLSERRARSVMNWLVPQIKTRAVAGATVYEARSFTAPRIRKCGATSMNAECKSFSAKPNDPCLSENRRVEVVTKCSDTPPRGFDGSHGHKAYVDVGEAKLWGLFGSQQISKHGKCTPVLVRYGLIAIDVTKATGGDWGRVEVGGRVGYMKRTDFKLGEPASCRR